MDVFVANRSCCCVAIDQMRGDLDRLHTRWSVSLGPREIESTSRYGIALHPGLIRELFPSACFSLLQVTMEY